jgi:hypothetical protein
MIQVAITRVIWAAELGEPVGDISTLETG